MSTTIGTLMVGLGMDTRGLDRGVDRAAKGFRRLGSTTLNLTKTMAKLGIAMGAVGAVGALIAIKVGKDFEYSIRSVGAVAGATSDQLQQLEDKAREVGATTAFSATESADAMYNLASAGLEVNKILGATEHSVKLAGATAGDMSTATQLMAASMRVFNMEAGDAQRISDVFSQTVRSSMFTLEGLGDAMKYAGPIAGAFGWTIEETATALGALKNQGLEATQAGTTLRMAMVKLAKPSDSAKTILKDLGLTIQDINPEMNDFNDIIDTFAGTSINATQAMDVFGARAGGAMATLIKQARSGQVDLDKFLTTLQDSAGTAGEMYKQMMDTVEGQWQILKSALQETLLSVFDVLKAPLRRIQKVLIDIVSRVGTALKDNAGGLKLILNGIVDTAKNIAIASGLMATLSGDMSTSLREALPAIATWIKNALVTLSSIRDIGSGVIYVFMETKRAAIDLMGAMYEVSKSAQELYLSLLKIQLWNAKWSLTGASDEYLMALGGRMAEVRKGIRETGDAIDGVAQKSYDASAASEEFLKNFESYTTTIQNSMGAVIKELEDMEPATQAQADIIKDIIKSIEEATEGLGNITTGAGGGAGGGGGDDDPLTKKEQILKHYDAILGNTEDTVKSMNDIWKGGADQIISTVDMIGSGIADIMANSMVNMIDATKGSQKTMGEALGGLIGEIASMWGQYFVLQGTAKVAEGVITGNVAWIAGGSALIAAGSALMAFASLMGSSGGGGGGSGGGGGGGAGAAMQDKKEDRGPLITGPEHTDEWTKRGTGATSMPPAKTGGDTIIIKGAFLGTKREASKWAQKLDNPLTRQRARKPSEAS